MDTCIVKPEDIGGIKYGGSDVFDGSARVDIAQLILKHLGAIIAAMDMLYGDTAPQHALRFANGLC